MARKLRSDAPHVLTANRLLDGVVVYRTAAGNWSPRLDDAYVVTGAEDLEALRSDGAQDEAACRVVGLDVFEVEAEPAGPPRAVSQRETIRAAGPSITLPVDRPIPPVAAHA